MLDIILSLVMFMILSFMIMMAMFTEGGGSPRFSMLFALVITFLTMTIFHSIRYPIMAIVIGSGAFLFAKHYVTWIRPQNKIQQKSIEFYGEQLAKHLQGYRIMTLEMYAYESFKTGDQLDQVRLFIDSESYDLLIKKDSIASIRWEFIELYGLPDDTTFTNQLFLLLIIEYPHAQSIVMPIFAGYQGKKESGYYGSEFWRSGLSKLYPEGELNLYPLQQQWIDKLKYPNDVSTYFYTHVFDELHLTIPAPTSDEAMQLGLVSEQYLQRKKKKSYRFLERFDTYLYREKSDTIQYAVTLCQQQIDDQHPVNTA